MHDDLPTSIPSCVVVQELLIRMSQMRQTNVRPFAGLYILCSGDVWQLPPPDGCCLGDIPCEFIQASRRYFPAPTVAHGQSLLWSDAPTGMTGVTELQTCERTKDAWLRSIRHSFSFGKFKAESHAFWHGESTMQPGSILNGNIMCGNTKCAQISSAAIRHLSFNEAFAETT